MSEFNHLFRLLGSVAALTALLGSEVAAAQAPMDPDNPTCPATPNWSNYREMRFTFQEIEGNLILLAEGQITEETPDRLRQALQQREPYEIWLRSPGGDARAGNAAGRIIRDLRFNTRIPSGWACFSACNFMFMGGDARFIDPGGLFIVHMFTHTQNRDTIRSEISEGEESAVGLIGQIEQDSALLASEDNMFLIRMGVRPSLLREVMYQVSAISNDQNRETRRCLTQQQVSYYNVSTPLWNPDPREVSNTPSN
jgi:hypothetical protein